MFAKLLKYEWKATAGLLGILSAAAVGAGIACGLILRMIMGFQNSGELSDAASGLMMAPMMIVLVFLVLGLAAYAFATELILLHRFYKSRFTDEGYLTFTLPVSSHQNFLSALVNILIWSFLSSAVLVFCALVILSIGLSGDGMTVTVNQLISSIGEMFDIASGELQAMEGYAAYQALSAVLGFVSWFSGPVVMMSCITLGAVLAKKHKIITAVGLYYGLSMATSVITTAAEYTTILDSYAAETAYGPGTLMVVGIQILLQVVLAVGGCLLSVYLMDKKLNLP